MDSKDLGFLESKARELQKMIDEAEDSNLDYTAILDEFNLDLEK